MTTEEKLVDAERRLREISKIVYTLTPGSMKAHVHFRRDFDAIRKLTSPWYEAKEPPKVTIITDEQVEAASRALALRCDCDPAHWEEFAGKAREALTAAVQAGKPTESDMRAFGASDAACYYWPEGTSEHAALRAAYCRGAAECMGIAYLSETVEPPPPAVQAGNDRHDYLSTACHHGLHDRCRKSCKFCSTECKCKCHEGENETNKHVGKVMQAAFPLATSPSPPDQSVNGQSIQQVVLDCIEAIERGSSTAPVVECLRSILPQIATPTKELAEARKVIEPYKHCDGDARDWLERNKK